MRKILLLATTLLSGAAGHTQLSYIEELNKKQAETKNVDTIAWVYTGVVNLGFNQGILHNWAAGGELASLAVNGLANGSLTYYHNKSIWTSS
ncbi:MAG: hypothetical protein EOP49_15720, partial [Sphingobacteriales bacterium]